jgi:hypothetical protein
MFKKISKSVKRAYVKFAFLGLFKTGEIRWYKGIAYVFRGRSQYFGWYSAVTGKKLNCVYGFNIELKRT